jgi:hypothetical protein
MAIAVGQRYKLLRQIGNDVLAGTVTIDHPEHGKMDIPDTTPAEPLRPGLIGEVIAFSPADELGASHHDGDCWVVAFPVPAIQYIDGLPQMVTVPRNYAVSQAELEDPTYYEPVTEEVSA